MIADRSERSRLRGSDRDRVRLVFARVEIDAERFHVETVRMIRADEFDRYGLAFLEMDDVRTEFVENLQRRGDYVIIAFLREAVGERGGPHISPLGAYDAESDSFLVLDVNPATADWVWMPTKTLIRGMRTLDKVENRGYILIH